MVNFSSRLIELIRVGEEKTRIVVKVDWLQI